MKDCIGIVLARTGSRRIKNKNFLKLKNKFIFEYPMLEAIKSNKISKIIISTHKKKLGIIKKLSQKKEFRNKLIPHARNSKMLNNDYHMADVVNHIIKSDLLKNTKFKYIFMIYSTAILIKKKDFNNMLKMMKKYENNNACSVQTICKYPAPVEWALKMNKKNELKNKFDYIMKSSDKYNSYFYDTGGLQLFNKKFFNKKMKNLFLGYNIGKLRGIDVDDKEDLDLAKNIFFKKN